tara:strand:+ start:7365 stop:7574 length:210 start_codon:yes stop_codon:yes gene_type:complete
LKTFNLSIIPLSLLASFGLTFSTSPITLLEVFRNLSNSRNSFLKDLSSPKVPFNLEIAFLTILSSAFDA